MCHRHTPSKRHLSSKIPPINYLRNNHPGIFRCRSIMKANNLSDNQKVIKTALGETESATFPKKGKNTIVTWEETKLHSFLKTR